MIGMNVSIPVVDAGFVVRSVRNDLNVRAFSLLRSSESSFYCR